MEDYKFNHQFEFQTSIQSNSLSKVVLHSGVVSIGALVRVKLVLFPNYLTWEPIRDTDNNQSSCAMSRSCRRRLALCDLLAATCLVPLQGDGLDRGHPPLDATDFVLHGVRRTPSCRWCKRQWIFSCLNASECQAWLSHIQHALNEVEPKRPRHLLVFVNPFGGKKRAEHIYGRKVAPLFQLAGIKCTLMVTTRANYARDYLLDQSLSEFDGVVSVGGDGMLSEIVHGLLLRARSDAGHAENDGHFVGSAEMRPKLRVGVIPAGSTDTTVYSLHGTDDAATAAMHIVLGDSMHMDVLAVYSATRFLRYNLSLLGYGFYGDIIRESEDYRWMGVARYDYLGFLKFMANRTYTGKVTFLVSKNSAKSHPCDGTRCLRNCAICSNAIVMSATENNLLEENEWLEVSGEFLAVNSFLISCRNSKATEGVAPCAHLGDGCADLVLIKNCSRVDMLRHLWRTASKTSNQFDFNFVQVHRVRAFRFTSFSSSQIDDNATSQTSNRNSVWNCDGEPLHHIDLEARVFCQLLPIFARGPEKPSSFRSPCRCSVPPDSNDSTFVFIEDEESTNLSQDNIEQEFCRALHDAEIDETDENYSCADSSCSSSGGAKHSADGRANRSLRCFCRPRRF